MFKPYVIKGSVIRTLRTALATLLLLAASNALALGLGQIEVKSRINQPLLAEIPIVSTTPGELQALQARLASPETFRRVGLEPPQGIATDLRFSLGNDARGRPVIRVTTTAPVNQPVLNFLIEVDWGQGRLVREYSALIDSPRTASAPLQPAISAPVVVAPNVVQRPLAPVEAPITTTPLRPTPTTTTAAPVVRAPAPVEEPANEPAPASTAIMPPPAAVTAPRRVIAAVPVPTPIPRASPAPAPVARAPSQYGPIKAGETLAKIASGLNRASSESIDQTMLALLRANPDAFLDDNINLLRQGAVLRVPGSDDRGSISADAAQRVVREQMQQWRQARRPVIQPVAAVAGNAPKRSATAADQLERIAPAKPAVTSPAEKVKTTALPTPAPLASARPAKTQKMAQARLAIVPAAVPGKATGTRSGTNAGGEGSMLQQQLQQRDEDLAARKAEISDLKERVAELENLKQQQDQLLTMKDSELAAAQQRLADARKAASPVAATAQPPVEAATQTVQETLPAQEPPSDASNVMPWVWGSLAVVGLGLLAWLLWRRRPAAAGPRPRRGFDSEAMAASMRGPAIAVAPATEPEPVWAEAQVEDVVSPPDIGEGEQVVDVTELPTTPAAPTEAPTWHPERWENAGPVSKTTSPAPSSPRFIPSIDALPPESIAEISGTPVPEPVSAEQRLKLARAFLDIGDEHSARQLLVELMDGPDLAMRNDAAKLLRELG